MNGELNEVARCADCTSYPVSFCDQERFCRTVMETVSFMRPACDKQAERSRAPSPALEHLKAQVQRRQLNILSLRLDKGLTRARSLDEERRTAIAERQMIDAFRSGQSDDLLHKMWGGVVYFVRCGDFVKVGHTGRSIKERFDGLMNGNPYDLHLVGLVPGTVQMERRFHVHLKEHHHRLEWFRFDERCHRRIKLLITRNGGHYLSSATVHAEEG